MERVCLGKVVKLHGYLGQIKIRTEYDKGFDLKSIKNVYDESENSYRVLKIFNVKNGIVVGLENVTLEVARSFVNKNIYIDRDLISGKILIEDLKNSEVFFEDGEFLGKIYDVQDFGSAEVFYVKGKEGNEILFPNVKGLLVSFDFKMKKAIIERKRFNEVSDEN